RCDLFSLGCVLYAMCTGAPPFRGPTPLAVVRLVCEHQPEPVRSLNPEVPDWLDGLAFRLLAKDPQDRVQSAACVAAMLEGFLAPLHPPQTPAPQLPSPDGRPEGRLWSLRVPAFFLLVALLFLAVLLPGQQPPVALDQDFRGGRPLSPLLKLF